MKGKKTGNNLSGITRLYVKWGQKSFIFTLICIVWLVWRVSTKPSRLGYPCTQFATWQIALFFGSASTPLLSLVHKCISHLRRKEYKSIAVIALVTLLVFGSFNLYRDYQDRQFRIKGSGTIPASSLSISPLLLTSDLDSGGHELIYPDSISMTHAVVSFSHDPLISYGTSPPPFDQAGNPAYDFVWDTVERLQLGTQANPLDYLINSGDTVLIKPNWVDFGPGVYTRPEVVRPLIDMALAGGATTIYVGDGSTNVAIGETVMNSANYTAMTQALDLLYPSVNISTVNLNKRDYGWHWVNMSSNSSFAGSGYIQADLGTGPEPLYDHDYYKASDNQSVNPGGNAMGWYAVNDIVLDSDVIINVSKMKTHQEMIATMSIKNLVGFTLSSTFDDKWYGQRIAHHHYPCEVNRFTNDIFWRAILDMNKIVLYADQNGAIQPTQQRKYLNVVDAIEALERSQHHIYEGGGVIVDRNVILAGVDPVAVDAVGSRIMGYDYNQINSIFYADSDTTHPIGTNDPDKVIIVGDSIDLSISHVFEFNHLWSDYAGSLPISDNISPVINTVTREANIVTANITGGDHAYVLYQTGGVPEIEQMDNSGDIYTVEVPGDVTAYSVLAQDDAFNTAEEQPSYISVTITDNGDTGLHFGTLDPGSGRQLEASTPSVTITAEAENTANVEIRIIGTDFTGPATFDVSNAFYNNVYDSASATAMTDTYGSAWQMLAPGATLDVYHWLSVPGGTPTGSYSSTFTYQSEEEP